MAALPTPATQSPTVAAIYEWWQGKLRPPSRRLGASQIGEECERRQWYSFRWHVLLDESFDGRMRRLFDRGNREEAVFTQELRAIGVDVRDLDPSTGEQFTFTACDGHFVAKIDGVALGILEAPKTWHIVSYKTINAKGHAALTKNGVEKELPKYWAQSQVEMRMAALDRVFYLSACKDNDDLYSERIRADAAAGDRLLDKAARIIFAPEPPAGISEDPAFYKCKFCPAAQVCHTPRLPDVSCRTCLHATPERDGDGRWSCARWRDEAGQPETLPLEQQRKGCPEHRYIPALLRRWGEAVDADEQENWVQYRAADGFEFRNGAWSLTSFTSDELRAATPDLLRAAEFMRLRGEYAARFVDRATFGEPA